MHLRLALVSRAFSFSRAATLLFAALSLVSSPTAGQQKPRERDLKLPAAEARQPLPHRSAVRRRHPRALHLAGLSVDPLASDLSSMLIKSHYDAHKGPPQAPRLPSLRGHAPRLS